MLPQGSSHEIHAARFSSNKKRLVQECKNAVAHSRRATKNVESGNVFLHFMLHACECCMAKLTKNFCALLTFTENFALLV